MGYAKLNVWIRDENCKVVTNPTLQQGWDWVEVRYVANPENGVEHDEAFYQNPQAFANSLAGDPNVIAHVPLPSGQNVKAHVEITVPPGLYIVAGHICTPNGNTSSNIYTDKAIVVAKASEEANVDLIIPSVGTCAQHFYVPFIAAAAALQQPLPPEIVQPAVRAMLQISDTPIKTALLHANNAVNTVAKLNVNDPQRIRFNAVLNVINKMV